MHLPIFNEEEFSGINTSAGSGVVNYGPNNPYLSNLAEYKRKKDRSLYDEDRETSAKSKKNASHSKKTKYNKRKVR